MINSTRNHSNWTVICVPALAMALSACGREEPPPPPDVARPVKVMTLEAPTDALQRSFPGVVRAAERVELAFQVPGKLQELPAKQGDEVEAGALLAALDPRDYRSDLNAAQSNFLEAKSNFERGQELVKDGFISKTDFDRLKARFGTTRSELEKARKALEDTKLLAPFAGRVARRYVENFQEVEAKEPIVSLQDVSVLEIVVNAPERLIARKTEVGSELLRITATFDTVPDREFELEIKEFATEADPQTQTFEYVTVMPRPKGLNILPGMTGMVNAFRPGFGGPEAASLVIPAIAVVADNEGKSFVWVVDPATNKVQRRDVETGDLTGAAEIKVTSGLEAGDTVAVAAVTQLREGMEIRPVTEITF
jgi:RND family efflux transporter MFP subunit